MQTKKYYITTAIDYVNGFPHIGHVLEKVQSDIIARYRRSLKENVLFLSGTDENSLKNVRAAEKESVSLKEFVDRNAKRFYGLKELLNLSYDDFIRTTEDRHVKGTQKLWLACKKDIYKKVYKGLYCVGCEEFYKEDELEDGCCPEHKKKAELIEEENYFFKLSKYEKQLKKLIETDELKIIPETRKNEVLSFINQGLEDICISRSKERARGWGIAVPGDPSQIIWVWFDALSNYINALGYGKNEEKFTKWWENNENKLHVIGKGVLRFHAIYWPGILLSANLSLPKKIYAHGYITSDGQKMSKSLGNVVNPFGLVEKYGADAVRYFLLKNIHLGKDGDFTYEKFEKEYNSDLSKGIGNLVSRVFTLAEKLDLESEAFEVTSLGKNKFQEKINITWKEYKKEIEEFRFSRALFSVWELISFCDQYIEENKIWEKTENQKTCILCLLYTIFEIAKMLEPFLPETSEKILCQLGMKINNSCCLFTTKKGESLFPKI